MVDTVGTITEVNFDRRRGDDYSFVVSLKDEDEEPINITGCTFSMTIDESPTPDTPSTTALAVLTPAIEGVATLGQIRVSPSTISVGTVGAFFYDLQMTDSGGKRRTVLKGAWSVAQDVTKT